MFNMERFYQFSQKEYKLIKYAENMRDGRQKAQIPTSTIFMSIVLKTVWQRKSMLQLDQMLRLKVFAKYLPSPKANTVSDTTIQRSLATFDLENVRKCLANMYDKNASQMKTEIGDKKLKIAAIDGSFMSKFWASCILVIGPDWNLFLDAQAMPKRGTELPTSQAMLERLVEQRGHAFVDVLLLDGLYFAQNFINCANRASIDVICKTREATLSVIKDANALFDNNTLEAFCEIEYVKAFDYNRLCEFKICACSGFVQDGIHKTLKIARIQEFYPKSNKTEIFYVISTRSDLSAFELRELGHLRWQIENNGFKSLNSLAFTKRVFTHHPHTFLAFLLTSFVAFNLITLFLASLDTALFSAIFGKAKFTLLLFCFFLLASLFTQDTLCFQDS